MHVPLSACVPGGQKTALAVITQTPSNLFVFFCVVLHFITLILCGCVCRCACCVHPWKIENSFQEVALSFHHMGPRAPTQVIVLGDRHCAH